MPGIQKILAATDFSDRAAWAEKRAAALCIDLHCRSAELMTVRELEQLETLAQLLNNTVEAAKALLTDSVVQELRGKADELGHEYGVNFTCTVDFGQPDQQIAVRSEAIAADLIVIGAHGGNFFTDLFLGNTADKLMRRCRRPLLIVKNEPLSPYQHVLVPVDFSDDSRQAAQSALQIAPHARFTFLHAYDVWFAGKMSYAGVSQDHINQYRITAREGAQVALNRFIADLNAGHRLTRHIALGHPSAIVRDCAEKMQADLIVMGKHGRSRIEELIIGSVTRDTIDWTKCDIMVVPPLAT